MSTKNDAKSRLAIGTQYYKVLFQSGILLFPINSLRKLYLPCKLLKDAGMNAWGLDVGVEGHGNARIFFKSLLKAD